VVRGWKVGRRPGLDGVWVRTQRLGVCRATERKNWAKWGGGRISGQAGGGGAGAVVGPGRGGTGRRGVFAIAGELFPKAESGSIQRGWGPERKALCREKQWRGGAGSEERQVSRGGTGGTGALRTARFAGGRKTVEIFLEWGVDGDLDLGRDTPGGGAGQWRPKATRPADSATAGRGPARLGSIGGGGRWPDPPEGGPWRGQIGAIICRETENTVRLCHHAQGPKKGLRGGARQAGHGPPKNGLRRI